MEPHLPDAVLYRPKMGFSVPLAKWFRGPLLGRLRQSLSGGPMADTGWFDMSVVAQMVESHARGTHDHSQPLWQLVMFDAFLRNSLGAPAAAKGQAEERVAA